MRLRARPADRYVTDCYVTCMTTSDKTTRMSLASLTGQYPPESQNPLESHPQFRRPSSSTMSVENLPAIGEQPDEPTHRFTCVECGAPLGKSFFQTRDGKPACSRFCFNALNVETVVSTLRKNERDKEKLKSRIDAWKVRREMIMWGALAVLAFLPILFLLVFTARLAYRLAGFWGVS